MDEKSFELIIQSCFSIGVAAFLLIRVEREIKHLTGAIEQLRRCQVCGILPKTEIVVNEARDQALFN